MTETLRTVEGICTFYSAKTFDIHLDGSISVYNALNDNYHFYKWSSELNRYIFIGSNSSCTNINTWR